MESPEPPQVRSAAPNDRDALLKLTESLGVKAEILRREVGRVIVGQHEVVDELIITLLAQGHCLLEGVPGLAKTLLASTLGSVLSLTSGRIQFTPDLMPTDVTGTQVMSEDPATRERRLEFRRGPVFVNLLLADEINRTPPKTQAALLEAMQEGQVTVGGARHRLEVPFFVIATQNPIEQEGTYRLPEAQLDRFLLKVIVDYPTHDEEAQIIERTTGALKSSASAVLGREEILGLQRLVRSLHVTPHVTGYAARLVRSSRPNEAEAPAWARELIAWGAGPRAAQALILGAKARTLLDGRFAVTRADVRTMAFPVLRHRILPSFQAEAQGLGADDIIARLLAEVPAFAGGEGIDPVTRRMLRR